MENLITGQLRKNDEELLLMFKNLNPEDKAYWLGWLDCLKHNQSMAVAK